MAGMGHGWPWLERFKAGSREDQPPEGPSRAPTRDPQKMSFIFCEFQTKKKDCWHQMFKYHLTSLIHLISSEIFT